jgi:hypothetical protein
MNRPYLETVSRIVIVLLLPTVKQLKRKKLIDFSPRLFLLVPGLK